jgi:hypothetical protein
LKRFPGGFADHVAPVYENPSRSGIACANSNCIVHDPTDGAYASNKFHIVGCEPPRLRCFYCETDIESFWVADRKSETVFASNEPPFAWSRRPNPDLVFHATRERAAQSGFSPRVAGTGGVANRRAASPS